MMDKNFIPRIFLGFKAQCGPVDLSALFGDMWIGHVTLVPSARPSDQEGQRVCV